MKNVLLSRFSFFSVSKVPLKKKSVYSKKITNYIFKFKNFLDEKQKYKRFNFFFEKSAYLNRLNISNLSTLKKKGPVLQYVICFSFSTINTFLYVTDALGYLKFCGSSGLLGFKGKSKRSRFQILKLFFKKLRKFKASILKNKPTSLVLKNVGSYKSLIIRKVKEKFFIKVVKNYQIYSYNGCRKKKKQRK